MPTRVLILVWAYCGLHDSVLPGLFARTAAAPSAPVRRRGGLPCRPGRGSGGAPRSDPCGCKRFTGKRHAAGGQLVAQALQRQVLALGLRHHVEVQAGGRLADELLEGDGVDHVRVGAQLRQYPRPLEPPADAAAPLFEGGLGRRVVDLGADAGGPRGERALERLAVGNALRVVAVVVEDVQTTLTPGAAVQLEDVSEGEGPVVVLDHEPIAGAVGEQLEALELRWVARRRPPDMADHH